MPGNEPAVSWATRTAAQQRQIAALACWHELSCFALIAISIWFSRAILLRGHCNNPVYVTNPWTTVVKAKLAGQQQKTHLSWSALAIKGHPSPYDSLGPTPNRPSPSPNTTFWNMYSKKDGNAASIPTNSKHQHGVGVKKLLKTPVPAKPGPTQTHSFCLGPGIDQGWPRLFLSQSQALKHIKKGPVNPSHPGNSGAEMLDHFISQNWKVR